MYPKYRSESIGYIPDLPEGFIYLTGEEQCPHAYFSVIMV